MKLSLFDYHLPEELIAQRPVPRGKSRLFVLDRKRKAFHHRIFPDILEYINSGDLVVLNKTRVIPARLFGRRRTGGKVEIFILRKLKDGIYEVLAGPGRKAPAGEIITFDEGLKCEILRKDPVYGTRIAKFSAEDGDVDEMIERTGRIPLPPYIRRDPEEIDRERYQTVYAEEKGAVAAPTAGLHFTEEILKQIEEKGARLGYIVLHAGLGTFRPVKVEEIEKHRMEPEYFRVPEETAEMVNDTKKRGGKVLCVGTTVIRSLESVADDNGMVRPFEGETNLYIYPPYRFKVCDMILTNFHLPKSTLLILVSAFAGRELVLEAYKEAIKERYRFYSYGDAMLII